MQSWLAPAVRRVSKRAWRARRPLSVIAGVLLIAALILPGSLSRQASAAASRPTKQEIAQKILDSAGGQFLSVGTRLALEAMARGSSQISAGDTTSVSNAYTGTNANASKARSAKSPLSNGHEHDAGLKNVLVSNPGEDTNQPDQTTQSETTIAVSGKNVVVGFNDSQQTLQPFFTPATDLAGVAVSHDGGRTFTDLGTIPNNTPSINISDPWVASDSVGNFYYSFLVDDPFQGSIFSGVARSTDGGQTWSPPVEIPPPASAGTFFYSADKDAMTAGPGVGNLYDSWDDFTFTCDSRGICGTFSGLPVAHSTDGGKTWTTVYAGQVLNSTFGNPPGDCTSEQYIGAQPIVGPDGAVYVFALKFGLSDPTCQGAPFTEEEVFFKSTNGGATFGPEQTVAQVLAPSGGFFGAVFQLGTGQDMRNIEFPTVAFGGSTLYVAWNDGGDGSGHSHIRLATSTDGGATFTTRWVTSGSNDEIQPAISTTKSGVHVAYYEISRAADGTGQLDVFSADTSGSGFSLTRVTSQSFPGVYNDPQFDPIIVNTYMGDYIASASNGTNVYYAWGDNRDIVKTFLWPRGRHDPDVFFARSDG